MLHPTSPVTYEHAELNEAITVNDHGWIGASGYDRGGTPEDRHSYVLVPKFPGDATPCPAAPNAAGN